jgi:hypothetical protein
VKLSEGENHVISERDGFAVCQIWSRPDLSSEEGAKNAGQMVTFLRSQVLQAGTKYRGVIFDVRRGPSVFGPKTRAVLEELLARAVERAVRVAILTGDSATQQLQFRSLCSTSPSMTQVFDSEPAALHFLRSQPQPPKR